MKLYTNQTNFDCGPIAALNALRYHGRKLNPRSPEIQKFKKWGKFNPRSGIAHVPMHYALEKIGFNVKLKIIEHIREVEKYLDQGYSLILNYKHKEKGRSGRHYIYIIGHTKKFFITVNELDTKHAIGCTAKSKYTKDRLLTIFVLKNYKPKLI